MTVPYRQITNETFGADGTVLSSETVTLGPESATVGEADSAARLLTERERIAKGGVVGVGDKGVVALRFDDWQDAFRTNVYPLLTARALVGSLVTISRFSTDQPWGANTTFDDLRSWARTGFEVWCHGTDHKDPNPDGLDGIFREVVTAKYELEQQGVKVVGWTPPGTSPQTAMQPYMMAWDSPAAFDSYAGRLIQRTYGISEGYMVGKYRMLPQGIYHGVGGVTVAVADGATLAESKTAVDVAAKRKVGVTLMAHSGNFDGDGNMTLVEFEELLDYIVAKWDAGDIEVLTPSAMFFADHSDHRLDLITDGSFEDVQTGGAGTDWQFTWGNKTVATDGGRTGSNYLAIPFGETSYLFQTLDNLRAWGIAGEAFMMEAWVRPSGGAVVAQMQVVDPDDSSRLLVNDEWTIGSGASWTRIRLPFGIHPDSTSCRFQIRRKSGTGGLDVDDVSVRKI